MKSFHEQLVDHISSSYELSELKDHCFIFPTKRGGLFFKRALQAQHQTQDFMFPVLYSIEEFVETLTGMTITDELTLLFELYKVYQKEDRQANGKESELQFDDFYAWGKIILKDYDEIDRYLADAKKIYSSLQNIKEIDFVFGQTDEFREIVSRYRTLTERLEKTKLLTEFKRIWENVGKVYEVYQEQLIKQEKAYGGMLYRNLANVLANEDIDHRFKQYHFCGFNALSKSEEVIFDALYKAQKAQLYWDVDNYYLNDPKEEAGDFIRVYMQKWEQSVAFDANSLESPKQVSVHAIPQSIGQVHLAAQQVTNLLSKGVQPEKTAIVLADEKLLVPLLYALPMAEHKVNVTMGYPLRSTVVFDFLLGFMDVMLKSRINEGDRVFHLYDLKPLISNAYAAVFDNELYDRVHQWSISEKRTKITLNELKVLLKAKELEALFQVESNWSSIYQGLKVYLTSVFYHFKESNSGQTDQEFIYFLLKSLNQFNDYLVDKEGFSLKLIKKILQEYFRSVKVPFEGEPVQGVQVMGFLETRTLDFEHVVVVSANEGKIPAGRSLNSYIPFGLRRVFSLPTFEEQDAIYAYHFKRLIQRAEDVHFVYDNSTSGDSTGEKSRFILQQLKLYQSLDHYQVQELQYEGQTDGLAGEVKVEVQKSQEVQDLLQRFTLEASEAFLSPTSLSTYINCPLQFYLRHVARFKELEAVEEDIDARNLGNVVHRVLELLYLDKEGQEVDAEQIKQLRPKVEKLLEKTLEEEKIVQSNQTLTGKDRVTKQIMLQVIQKVLNQDIEDAPFEVVGLERSGYEYLVDVDGGKKARVSGTIDRMDKKNDVLRIIDYKTGKADFISSRNKDLDDILDEYFEDPDVKSGFQAYLYAQLTRPHYQLPTKVGITVLKKLNEGTKWLNAGKTLGEDEMEGFGQRLDTMVKEIFDPNVPFVQTEDPKRCKFCDFKKICRRA